MHLVNGRGFERLVEAEKYLKDLELRYPETQWEILEIVTGREPGHEELVYGNEAVLDLTDGTIHGMGRRWIWKSELIIPSCGVGIMNKYFPVLVGESGEVEATRSIQRVWSQLSLNYVFIKLEHEHMVEVKLKNN